MRDSEATTGHGQRRDVVTSEGDELLAAAARRAAMSRRGLLRAVAGGAVGIGGWSLLGGRAAAATGRPVASPAPQGPAAAVMPFNTNWLFGGQLAPGSTQPGFDDSNFMDVTLPHCVTPLSWRDWDSASWEQEWIYRRHFDLPPGAGKMRTFVDFAGALTGATPTINGHALTEHLGGYLPFSYELTDHLARRGNVLAVEVDARWLNVPPDGNPRGPASIDYSEPGGLYREVALRSVPQIFLADLFAKPVNVLSPARHVKVLCAVDAAVVPTAKVRVEAALLDGERIIARASAPVHLTQPGQATVALELAGLGAIRLWHVDSPHLYRVVATLYLGDQPIHDFTRRIGFRDAVFRTDGFFLNGKRFKLFGLNRHQIFPYLGMAMPPRVQRRDAGILKKQLNCNMVRCSHYPQSPDFLDACDELGIMVWEETPGWGYLGDAAWQQIMRQNVHDMVVRDRSRPSVIIWGVKPNEATHDDPALYTESKKLADSLDGSRPTSGTSYHTLNDFVFDVMAYDDYGHSRGNAELHSPISGVPYLVTEAVGALDGSAYFRWTDIQQIQQSQARMHAQVHDIAGSEDAYCGLLGWCAFDYGSAHGNVYHSIKWPGVADTFRVLKPGAAFYQAQGDPAAGPVIEPAFYWDFGPTSPVTSLGSTATICSNCDRIEAYLDGAHLASLTPDTANYPHLAHPPFHLDVSKIDGATLPELRLDGYVGSRLALSRSFSADPSGDRLEVTADDAELTADGSDATRVAFRAVDRYGAPRPYADGVVSVAVHGPGTYVGEVVALTVKAAPELLSAGKQATVRATLANAAFPFGDNGGVGAVYIRTLPWAPGTITVTVSHPTLGSGSVRIRSTAPRTPASGSGPIGPTRAPSQELTRVALALDAPDGWTVRALSPTTFAQVAAGRSVVASWQVTAPSSIAQGASTTLTAKTTFLTRGQPATTSTRAPVYLATTLTKAFNNTGISDGSSLSAADFDGKGRSYSEQALTAAGLAPGAVVTHGGISFTWPDVPAGQPDNVLADGQTILVSGSGNTLGFLGASSYMTTGVGYGKVFYTDGSTSTFSLLLDNYLYPPGPENSIVATMPYLNQQSGRQNRRNYVFYAGVPVDGRKTVKAVTLLDGGFIESDNGKIRGTHIFAIGVG